MKKLATALDRALLLDLSPFRCHWFYKIIQIDHVLGLGSLKNWLFKYVRFSPKIKIHHWCGQIRSIFRNWYISPKIFFPNFIWLFNFLQFTDKKVALHKSLTTWPQLVRTYSALHTGSKKGKSSPIKRYRRKSPSVHQKTEFYPFRRHLLQQTSQASASAAGCRHCTAAAAAAATPAWCTRIWSCMWSKHCHKLHL